LIRDSLSLAAIAVSLLQISSFGPNKTEYKDFTSSSKGKKTDLDALFQISTSRGQRRKSVAGSDACLGPTDY
jgi:hypothetical protein